MISDSEFVMIRAFDKTVADNRAAADRIIARKNAEIGSAARIIAHLKSQLAATQRQLAASEAKYENLRRQVIHSAVS